MIYGAKAKRLLGGAVLGLGLLALGGLGGCQVDVGGQTLPSAYYMQDDVQYFAPGSEFRLAREAAALKQAAQQPPAARR
ncbi:MAG: hypothetical protein NZ602_10035 [Thermoguttaceae bacterium]|nr:hypothetical protein [Thermoguttaceae bacterium]MDW8038117.1 hypothetical protein [Thermoguttaceae bacterium]